MNILFFDTETTGVPKDYKAPVTDLDNWPRVIQLAWSLVDFETREILTSKSILIKPDGWEIPKEKFWIDNGFSTGKNLTKGLEMSFVLLDFTMDLNNADVLVAHNFDFDHPILAAEMIRYQIKPQARERQKICTMKTTINFCKVPFPNRGRFNSKQGYKWPKLDELYFKLFNRKFDGAHDAGFDTVACKDCFFELVKRGIITLK